MLPLGYAFVAALPGYRRIGLHVVFIGCFALMVFAVSVHVVLSHGGTTEMLSRSPRRLKILAGLLFAALASRMIVDLNPERTRLWIGAASGAFLLSTLAWVRCCVRLR